MGLPCEKVVSAILPLIRAEIAKTLVLDFKLTQIKAAKLLGLTQAAVSQYVTSKRGYKLRIGKSSPASRSIKETAKELAEGKLSEFELLNRLCEICHTIREEPEGIQKNKMID
ncbi:MAG: transcriptional regulator [Candidatus Hodarchaeota archaeon]